MRGSGAPAQLSAQAKAVLGTAAAARLYFGDPSEPLAEMVRQQRLKAQKARAAADAALETTADRRADWFIVSAALAEIGDEAAWAVDESERFQAPLGAVGPRLAASLEQAMLRLTAALEQGGRAAAALAEAKSKALQIEEIRRMARQAALARPGLTAELSTQAVLERFSRSAEAVHRAADVLAARLGEGA